MKDLYVGPGVRPQRWNGIFFIFIAGTFMCNHAEEFAVIQEAPGERLSIGPIKKDATYVQ